MNASAKRNCCQFNRAIVRTPAASVAGGLRAVDKGNPDYMQLRREHAAYIDALATAGLEVTVLPELQAYPDAVFVEDPALVFSEGAILLRPGAPTRRGEVQELAPVLHELFDTVMELPQPGCADGGDILVMPHTVFIGLSARTDQTGAAALQLCLEKLGLQARIVPTPAGVLHFKTACSLLDEETVLLTEAMATADFFAPWRKIVVPRGDEPAANVLRINGHVLVSAGYPRTLELLDRNGYSLLPVPTTEIEKIDAGLSCMSLRWLRR